MIGRLGGFLLALALIAASAWLGAQLLSSNLPSVSDLGPLVHGSLANHGASYTHLSSIPVTVQQSTIAIEDARFLTNSGVDPHGILRAVVDDVVHHCLCEGGSTITQQLAKQVYLAGNDASVRRKLDTIILAIEIDHRYRKSDILEFYLNATYYGHGAYGVESASLIYWRLPIDRVDLAQAAMLAGLPQAPSDYDPIQHPDAARARRATVLARLLSLGLISSGELQRANAQPLAAVSPDESGTIRLLRASYVE